MWGTKFFQLFFLSLLWSRRAVAKVAYACAFSEDVKECANYKNDYVDSSGLMLKGDDGLGLAGIMDVKLPIVEGYEMCAEAWKITEVGNELVFNACGDICSNLNDENSPWYPIFNALNATVCPVEAKVYEVDDMSIDLGFANEVMCHEFCAEYQMTLAIMDGRDKISCHQFIVNIYEYEKDE